MDAGKGVQAGDCERCIAGHYAVSGKACTVCAAGKSASIGSGTGECDSCAAGRYAEGIAPSDFKITSCSASDNQGKHPCNEAFDGVTKGSDNGWAYDGKVPAWAEFTLASASTVNQLDILTGVDRGDHHINDFKVEMRVGGTLRAPETVHVDNTKATVVGSHIQVQDAASGCFPHLPPLAALATPTALRPCALSLPSNHVASIATIAQQTESPPHV